MNKIITIISAILLVNSLINHGEYDKLEGKYQIRPGFNIVISCEEDGIYVEPDRKPKEKLTKLSESLYRIESIEGTIDFSMILNNKRDRLIIKMFGQTLHAPRLPVEFNHPDRDEIDVSYTKLKNYEGIYQINGDTMFFVTADDNELKIQLTGQPELQVYPFEENKFFYKAVDAEIEFVKNNNGTVDYLLLYQNGIILQADRK